jgi:hypothetical protein
MHELPYRALCHCHLRHLLPQPHPDTAGTVALLSRRLPIRLQNLVNERNSCAQFRPLSRLRLTWWRTSVRDCIPNHPPMHPEHPRHSFDCPDAFRSETEYPVHVLNRGPDQSIEVGQLLNFRASNGDVQHLPRIRLRFGQNLFLSEHPSKPFLGIYEGALVQFPEPSYSRQHFQGARFFAGYGFYYRKRVELLLGFKVEAEVSTNGSTVTLFYGPAFSVEYRFTRRQMNEKHLRTTAFKDF